MIQNEVILILGGARSGKSALAEDMAAQLGRQVIYVATAGIHDQEMEKRVQLHRVRRPSDWQTVEETHDLSRVWEHAPLGSVVLVDCLTLWVTNLLLDQRLPQPGASKEQKEQYILDSIKEFIRTGQENKNTLILVSNEVGLGIVPDNELGRLFRDLAGKVNQCVAGLADRVFFVIAGMPMEIKAPSFNSPEEENQ